MPSEDTNTDYLKTAIDKGVCANHELVSQLMLTELQRLNKAINNLTQEINTIKLSMTEVKSATKGSEEMWNKLNDMNDMVKQHEQTIFGAHGDNGLSGDIKTMKEDVDALKTFKIKAIAYAVTIGVVLGLVKDYLFFRSK